MRGAFTPFRPYMLVDQNGAKCRTPVAGAAQGEGLGDYLTYAFLFKKLGECTF